MSRRSNYTVHFVLLTVTGYLVMAKLILDVGGEGRHPKAWNVNPSPVRTIGPHRGEPIPRHIAGRIESIPLPAAVADVIIVERTPLRAAGLAEILRVIKPAGRIVLRHARPEIVDPHQLARAVLPGHLIQRIRRVGRHVLQESVFHLPAS